MRAYYLPNTAAANIQCCGAWLHIGHRLMGIAPNWWYEARNRSKRPFRLGLSILVPDYQCASRTVFKLAVCRFDFAWRSRGERGAESGLSLRVRR